MADASVPGGPVERLFEELLVDVRTTPPMELNALLNRYAAALGMDRATVYLIDLQQRVLAPLPDGQALGVNNSLAGWAYRTQSLRVTEEHGSGLTAWLPLVDGAERLGVLEVETAVLDGLMLRRCKTLAALLSLIITSKRHTSDTVACRTRVEPMELPAEMVRAFLPPRTIGTRQVVSTAVLEPAYNLGGDAFDHAITENLLHATILDGMGHDLASGLTTAVALAGCRNARRNGADLPELVGTVDAALSQWLPERFCTGVIAQLDMTTGLLRWCNCGHPPPLLIRGQRLVDGALDRPPEPPLGLPARLADISRTVHEATLEPGDRMLLYTDGVVDAPGPGGEKFGLARFTDFIIRTTAAGEPAPEALRLLIHAILDHQRNQLSDDATILTVEWLPGTHEPSQAVP